MTQPSSTRMGSSSARSSASGVSVQPGPCTSASSSTNRTPRRAATARPSVVLPFPLAEAMIATRRTGQPYLSADERSEGSPFGVDHHARASAMRREALGDGLEVGDLPERLDRQVEPYALLARAPQRDRRAAGEHHACPAD